MAAAVGDVDTPGKSSNLSDLAKRVAPCATDNDSNGFRSRFMEKLFSDERKCSKCGAPGSVGIVQTDESMELYITEVGVVGKQQIRCTRCSQVDTVASCDRLSDVPTDQRLRIHGVEVRDYIQKITHLVVLHDLMELLQIAAVEDEHNRHEKHLDIANFMMQKARRVCEEWCKAEYAELRYKKFLHLCDETLIVEDYIPSYPHHASDEYKEMYQMMAGSFRANRDKLVRLLQLMKESLFDNPSRPSFMLWVNIAMMHTDCDVEFKQQYDPRTFMKMESSIYSALKDRYLSLNIPVGIEKIPVVFVLFELPRFYHFVDFLTRKLGKKKPRYFLSDEERSSLRRYEAEMELTHTHKSGDPSVMGSLEAHLDFKLMYKCDAMESERKVGSCDSAVQTTETAGASLGSYRPPRVVTSEQFRDALVEHLQGRRFRRGDVPPPWTEGQKVVLKIETNERGDCSLKELMERLSKPVLPVADKHAAKAKQKHKGVKIEKQSTGDSQGSVTMVEERKSETAKTNSEVVPEKKSEGTNQASSKKATVTSDKPKPSPPPSVKKSSSSAAKKPKQVPASTQTQTDPPKHSKSTSSKSSSSKSSRTQASSKTTPPTTPPIFPFANLPPNFPPQLSNLLPLVSAHIPLPTGPNMRTAAVITAGPPSADGEPSSSYTISILPNVEITPEIAKHLIPSTAYSNYVQNPLGPPPTPPPSASAPTKKKSKKESVPVKKDSTKSSTSSSSKSEDKSSTPTNTSPASSSKNSTGKRSNDKQQSVSSPPPVNSAAGPGVITSLLKTNDRECEGSSESTSDEDHPKPMNARRLTRMLKNKPDNQHFRFSEKGTPISDCNPEDNEELISYLTKCYVVHRSGFKQMYFEDLPGQIFDKKRDTEISVEVPVMGPRGEFVVTPMIFAYDDKGGTVPIMPVIVHSKKPEDTVTTLELVARLFRLPLGKEITQKQKEVFLQYLEIAMAGSRSPHLLYGIDTGAIKGIRTQKNCTVVRLNVTDILQEAAEEDYRSAQRGSRKASVAVENKVNQCEYFVGCS